MLENVTRTQSFSAQSVIGTDNDKVIVAYMGATQTSKGELDFSFQIVNKDAYVVNKETVDADMEQFKDDVMRQA
jgi:hypothetical protein